MASTDKELGARIQKVLKETGLDPTSAGDYVHGSDGFERVAIEGHVHGILERLGLNLEDQSLKDTPRRVAAMYCDELFYGLDYANFPACTLFETTSKEMDELVMVDNIEVKSMCEHHLIPFVGTCSIGYIPAGKMLGLSKFNRVVDFFSRRPQVQERLTAQIALAFRAILGTEDIAVVMQCEHLCAKLRGVKAFQSVTRTSNMQGRFRAVEALRQEFLMQVSTKL